MPLKGVKQRDDVIRCGVLSCLSGCYVGDGLEAGNIKSGRTNWGATRTPVRGHGGLNEGGGYDGGEKLRKSVRAYFWRGNKQNLVRGWRWGMNEKEVPKMATRCPTWQLGGG